MVYHFEWNNGNGLPLYGLDLIVIIHKDVFSCLTLDPMLDFVTSAPFSDRITALLVAWATRFQTRSGF
jgi:hypothetical protein